MLFIALILLNGMGMSPSLGGGQADSAEAIGGEIMTGVEIFAWRRCTVHGLLPPSVRPEPQISNSCRFVPRLQWCLLTCADTANDAR